MPIRYEVQPGDCISSIGFRYGIRPDQIWQDEANDDLRTRRESGYVLQPGDVIVVPDRQVTARAAATGARHVFRRRDVPEKLNVAFRDADGKPRTGLAFTLEIDGAAPQEGTTDGEGAISAWIPPDAVDAVLRVDGYDPIPVRLGHLDPVTSEAGLRARLANLGFLYDPDADDLSAAVAFAQQVSGLTPTGVPDDDLRRAVVAAHGS